MSEEKDYYKNLVSIMLKTRGVRFSVAENLKSSEKISIFSVTVLSIYITSLSIFTALFPESITESQGRALSLILVVASFSLLTISLFDHAAGRAVLSEKMLQNAFAITAIMREAERELAKEAPDFSVLEQLATRYETVVNASGINHTSLDYKIWNIEKTVPSDTWGKFTRLVRINLFRVFRLAGEMAFQFSVIALVLGSTIIVLHTMPSLF